MQAQSITNKFSLCIFNCTFNAILQPISHRDSRSRRSAGGDNCLQLTAAQISE